MKHLKEKLFATIAMLLVATVMLTSASFAWFTISTAPEISDVKASVTANGNLEIALDAGEEQAPAASTTTDAGKNETWGNLVDLKECFETSQVVLKPVSVTKADLEANTATMKYPHFGLDGRIDQLMDLNRLQAADGSKDNFKDFGGVWVFSDNATSKTGASVWAYEVDFWLRTNVAGTASLTTAKDRDGGQYKEAGLGSYITDNRTTIKLVYDGEAHNVTLGTVSDGKYPLTADAISLTVNQPKLIKMFVYLDGTNLTNADFKNTVDNFTMNVQFEHSATLNDLDGAQANFNRASAGAIGS